VYEDADEEELSISEAQKLLWVGTIPSSSIRACERHLQYNRTEKENNGTSSEDDKNSDVDNKKGVKNLDDGKDSFPVNDFDKSQKSSSRCNPYEQVYRQRNREYNGKGKSLEKSLQTSGTGVVSLEESKDFPHHFLNETESLEAIPIRNSSLFPHTVRNRIVI
jgi:hypothetical protein